MEFYKLAFVLFVGVMGAYLIGRYTEHEIMKHECASIMTAGVPIPLAPVVYLSKGE